MKRPLAMVALPFAGGILLGQFVQPPLALLFGSAFGLAALAVVWSRARPMLLWALLPLAGWANETARTALLAPDDLRILFAQGPQEVALRGTICAPPSARIFLHGAEESWRTSMVIDTEAMQNGTNWTPAFGRLAAAATGLLDSNYFAGQSVLVRGVIRPPRGPAAPGSFDARRFYANEGIYFQLQTQSTNDWSIVSHAASRSRPLGQRFRTWAQATLARGMPEEDEPLRLLWALALDWRAALTGPVEEPFVRAGTFHIFAVDGLRISLLTGICVALLRVVRTPRAWCGAISLPLIWSYTALTGWPPSAVRAAIMMTIIVLGWALRRPGDLLNSLFAAAFIILCWDPRQLFQAGFQLSFLIVFGIAILLPPARAFVYQRVFRGDPFLPDVLRSRPPDWLWRGLKFCIDMLLLSWAAWLASIPLAALFFHVFTPWSVPANFLVVPLTGLALTACIGSLCCGAWLPGVAGCFNHSAWFWMKSIVVISERWADWRPGPINMAAPAPITLAWYYLVLLTVASGWIFKTRWKTAAWTTIAATTALLAAHETLELRTTRLTVLPARGGSVVFIDKPAILLDCGNPLFADAVLRPFLQAQGVNRLALFCLTSDHLDQIGGAEVIRTNLAITQFDRLGQPRSGDTVAGWMVLHPAPGERHSRADDDALVLRQKTGAFTILLLSRLGRAGQDSLLARHGDLRSDIVIAALPAQDEPLSGPLLDAVAPKLIILADTDLPATRRATPQLRERLGRRGAKIFYGRDVGAMTLELRGDKCRVLDAGGACLLTMID